MQSLRVKALPYDPKAGDPSWPSQSTFSLLAAYTAPGADRPSAGAGLDAEDELNQAHARWTRPPHTRFQGDGGQRALARHVIQQPGDVTAFDPVSPDDLRVHRGRGRHLEAAGISGWGASPWSRGSSFQATPAGSARFQLGYSERLGGRFACMIHNIENKPC